MDSAQFLIEIETQMKGGANAVTELGKLEKNMKGSGLTAAFANTHIFALRRAVDHLGGPVGKVLGPIFRFGEGLHKMAKQGGAMGLATGGALLAAGAVAGLTAKFVEGGVAALKFGLSTANAARDQGLTLEAMTGSAKAGDALGDAFVAIQKKTGATSEHLMQLTEELGDAHLSGADMATALGAIATQEAAIGTGKTKLLVDQLRGGQVSANAMANTINSKFGGVVSQKMLGLDQQFETMKTNVGLLFGGLKIDGFLEALSKLIGLLDENTASGKALKFLFESVFQPLVDAATAAIPYVELAVLRFVNVLLRMYIAARPAVQKIEDLFGITPSDGIQVALTLAELAAYTFVAALGVVIALVVATGAVIYGFAAAFGAVEDAGTASGNAVKKIPTYFHQAVAGVKAAVLAIPGAVSAAIDGAIAFVAHIPTAFADAAVASINLFDAGINALPDAVDAVVSTISAAISAVPAIFSAAVAGIGTAFAAIPGLLGAAVDFVTALPGKFSDAGTALIDGLVAAITSGAARVIAAVTNLGNDAVGAAKKIFKIHSPSKVFAEIGDQNAEGLALGHEQGADRVQSSIDSMTELPESSPLKRGGRGGGNTYMITIHASGPNAKENAREIRRELENFLEEEAISVGVGLEATA